MTERSRRCRYRGALTVRAGRADFADTMVVGSVLAAAIAAYAWLIETMSIGG